MLLKDGIRSHRKVLKAGAEAAWLWVAAIDYCRNQRTNGFVPMEALPTLGNFKTSVTTLAERAVAALLLEQVEGGFRVHDYLDHNDSAEQLGDKKERAKARKEAWKERKQNDTGTPLEQRSTSIPSSVPKSSLLSSNSVPPTGASAYPRVGVGSGVGVGTSEEKFKPEDMEDVGVFVERWPELVTKLTGRPVPLEVGPRYYPDALTLVGTYGLPRCLQLAEALITTPHWDGKPRTIAMLRAHAPEIDRWLIEHPGIPFRAPLQNQSSRQAANKTALANWAAKETTS